MDKRSEGYSITILLNNTIHVSVYKPWRQC